MDELGQHLRVPAIRFERQLPGSAEAVWTRLTQCDQLPAWFGDDGLIEPREGGAVRLSGGHIRGVVTQWKPPRRLTYTWNVFGPGEEESPFPESYLSLELTPDGAHTMLVLIHLPVLERFEKQNAMGWHTFLDMVEAAMKGETPALRRTYMERNAARYGVDLNNLQR